MKWGILVVLGAGVAFLVLRGGAEKDTAPGGEARPAASQTTAPARERVAEERSRGLAAPSEPVGTATEGAPGAPPAGEITTDGEYPVDLAALRTRMPDNLYWLLGAPTEDPAVLQQRSEEEVRWNEMLGKVQSGTASDEEIDQYYDHKRRVSEDYLAFANAVLEEHRSRLPERDVGMYELSQNLHKARLAEIPRQIEDARARKQAQDARREAWRKGGGSGD
ncbi:hypothetical protein [Chondromyces crocatus]|nr:hypothetical protein [Chondromyces crocatus]